jgi:uncharacterized nucleotidyltransferase DUF6036
VSLRQAVNRERISLFLREVGQRYHRLARLYLVGGTSLVFEGYRERTLDVDLTIEVSADGHAELIQALQEIMLSLDINIEEASPGDFIPLPAGYADRHIFLGRYGQVDVFHFDLYSNALSKIERGRRQDLADVVILLNHDRIEWGRLEGMYREIWPLMGQKSLRQKPQDFALNFEALRALWHSAGGTH